MLSPRPRVLQPHLRVAGGPANPRSRRLAATSLHRPRHERAPAALPAPAPSPAAARGPAASPPSALSRQQRRRRRMWRRRGPARAEEAAECPGREQPRPGQPGAPGGELDRQVSVRRSPPSRAPEAAAGDPGGGKARALRSRRGSRGSPWRVLQGAGRRVLGANLLGALAGRKGGGAWAPAGRARRAGRPTGASLGEGSPGRRCGAQTALTCAVGAGSVAKARGAAWAGKGGAAEGERREVEGGRQRAGGGSGSRMPTRCDLRSPISVESVGPRPGSCPRRGSASGTLAASGSLWG